MYCIDNPVMYVDHSGKFPWLILAAVLLFTPIGGIALQVAASVTSYAVMAIWALGDLVFNGGEGAWADMCSINWNPFNTDVAATLKSNNVSFYKGVPVFRTNLNRSSSFSIIFLANGSDENDLRHERGHNSQLMIMGIAIFSFTVGIPSSAKLGYWNKNDNYYGAPWETMADILGGVEDRTHSESEIATVW